MKRLYLLLTLLMAINSITFADTVYLKSGKKIEGKIIEKTDEYIKLEFYGIPLTYYFDQIETIEAEGIEGIKGTRPEVSSLNISDDNLYVNEFFGFKILTPNWMESGFNPRQIEFSKDKEPKKGVFQEKLLISIDKSSNFPNVNSALTYAEGVANDIKAQWKESAKIIEPAQSVKIDNLDAATLTYELLGKDKAGNEGLVTAHYFYYLGDDVVVLMFADADKTFRSNLTRMTKYLKSFKMLSAQDNLTNLTELNKKEVKFLPLDSQEFATFKSRVLESMNKKGSYKSYLIIRDRLDKSLSKYDFKGMELGMTFLDEKNFEIAVWDYIGGVGDIWRVAGDEVYIKIGFWMPMPTEFNEPMQENNKEALKEMVKRRREAYKDLSFRKIIELLEKETPSQTSGDIDNFVVLKFIPTNSDFLSFIDPEMTISKKEVLLWILKNDNTLRFAKTTIEGKDKDGKPFLKEYEHYFNNFDLPYTLGEPQHIYQKD